MASTIPQGRYIPINANGNPKKDNTYALGGPLGTPTGNKWLNIFGIYLHGNTQFSRWADVAELYIPDCSVSFGNIVSLGGDREITLSNKICDTNILGIVSESPALVMNKGLKDGVPVALMGRVKALVKGKVIKGQKLVSSEIIGVAEALPYSQLHKVSYYSIIGTSLENKDTNDTGYCNIVVGLK